MAFCVNCGGSVVEQSRFCQSCGYKLGDDLHQADLSVPPSPAMPIAEDRFKSATPLIQGLSFSDSGASFKIVNVSISDGIAILDRFMSGLGFSCTRSGTAVYSYSKGSAIARAAVGGLAKREKYVVSFSETVGGIYVKLTSEMSGWGGGIPGKLREKSGRENIKQALTELARRFS